VDCQYRICDSKSHNVSGESYAYQSTVYSSKVGLLAVAHACSYQKRKCSGSRSSDYASYAAHPSKQAFSAALLAIQMNSNGLAALFFFERVSRLSFLRLSLRPSNRNPRRVRSAGNVYHYLLMQKWMPQSETELMESLRIPSCKKATINVETYLFSSRRARSTPTIFMHLTSIDCLLHLAVLFHR
jgi:hypothetical protein